jgi:hypothetical protein
MEDLQKKILLLEEENKFLKTENEVIKDKLNKYNQCRKNYYEENKDIVNDKAKKRLKKIAEENPEKLKEYRRTAYLKRKENMENEKQKSQEIKEN